MNPTSWGFSIYYIQMNIKQSNINKSYLIRYNANNRDKWFFD